MRRTLAAFLRTALDLRAQPRNPKKPAHFPSYSLEKLGDERLTQWLRPDQGELRLIESELLQHWQPPLNGQGVKTPWPSVAARRFCRASRSEQRGGVVL